ncbi:poly(A)-specific ribonuclease [Paramarasmius palmivorus]|uniref:PAN2-PAN3 deadenylation complex catalytic subunit PAN2 n=1 Tax=Paramarasmius palmivorus TaxID=297713 RepID=A0AAW0DDX7_9AGAR
MSGFQYALAPIVVHPYPQPVSALSFDPVSDTLWAGSGSGYVSAHHGTRGLRGVCFRAGNHAIQKIISSDNSVKAASTGGNGVGSWAKGGTNKWFYNSSSNITTFASANLPGVAASTVEMELIMLNAMTGGVIRQLQMPSLITNLEFSHSLLLSGAADGYLRAHDPRTGMTRNAGAESSVKAHYSSIQGLETIGNFVFTIGLSLRQSHPFPDPLVKVYDLRNMRPLPPIPFSASPAFITAVPKRSSSIAIASNQGLINIVDVTNPGAGNEFYQLDLTSYITSIAFSPTGAYLACGDAEGVIHLRSQAEDTDDIPLNGFEGKPIEWTDAPEPLPAVEWQDSTPLNSIGLPHYKSQLFSAWSPQFAMSTPTFPPPQKIPLQVLNTMKMNDNIAYAPLPKELKGKRNMVTVLPRKRNPRFHSGKSRSGEAEPETPFDSGDDIPKIYRLVEIEYSKFGVEDFDFGFYNKTDFSGLETHILNSYTNPLVQVMHYCLPIRQLAKSHITTECPREHCLLCELGFVVRMLEDAHGTNCQASNFCKTAGVLAQASNAIDLIDYGRTPKEVDYSYMIQSFHRFLVERLSIEGNSFPGNPVVLRTDEDCTIHPAPAPVTQLLGIDAKTLVTCLHCKSVREKESMTHVIDMAYPRKFVPLFPGDTTFPTDFPGILRNSLLRKVTHKATCQSCKNFTTFASRRLLPTKDLPPVLAVNACVNTDEDFSYWVDTRNSTFLKPQIEIRGQMGEVDDPDTATYELRAMILQVVSNDQRPHLVAIVKVPDSELKNTSAEGRSPWYVFNDFVVSNISEEEALSIPDRWKVPSVLYLERSDTRETLDFSGLPDQIDPTILCRDTSISVNRDPTLIKQECLAYDELPRPGTLVAIDAEFVSMQQEETEFKSDGTKKVIRPARLSLARVSVLRGNGAKEGVPFIDDHIHTSEAIVDYLTEFSGIRFGDLDPLQSPHTLTPLKVVYKKLRLLVDRGCIFIGHGLSKDFRIINIFVPPHQVIDTVDLYFLKARQRRLSLRFLSWFVLGQNIQTDTHDSIEDARSALQLYKAYQEFEEQGVFDQKLEELYKEGRQFNFKPPPLPGSQVKDDGRDTPNNTSRMAYSSGSIHLDPKQIPYPSSQSQTPIPTNFVSPFPRTPFGQLK